MSQSDKVSLQLFQHLYHRPDITGVFRIAYLFKPKKIVASLISVLDLCIIGADRFSPMRELVVFAGPGIGETEQIVLVATYR